MKEHFFTCPYCWEKISMLFEPTITIQTYIEDCEICCQPIQIELLFLQENNIQFKATSIEQ
ncbi:MAG: CPXCG motif-containing cysteine-rich protein [Flavobacteriaceae bacterium]|nr:CPXCG motif-containing cysteine-rich protein [Flavobacteriaceae bacterium]